MLDLGGHETEHILSAIEELGSGSIVNASLRFVEALESILLVAGMISAVRLEEAVVRKGDAGAGGFKQLPRGLKLGEGKGKIYHDNEDEQDGRETDLAEWVQQCLLKDVEGHDGGL